MPDTYGGHTADALAALLDRAPAEVVIDAKRSDGLHWPSDDGVAFYDACRAALAPLLARVRALEAERDEAARLARAVEALGHSTDYIAATQSCGGRWRVRGFALRRDGDAPTLAAALLALADEVTP